MPCIFHEFVGVCRFALDYPLSWQAEAIPYDGPGTDAGNGYKAKKQLSAYDDDARATIDLLVSLPNCNGRIGATGMCVPRAGPRLTVQVPWRRASVPLRIRQTRQGDVLVRSSSRRS